MGPARGGGGVKEGQDRNEESGDLHEPGALHSAICSAQAALNKGRGPRPLLPSRRPLALFYRHGARV